MWNDFDEWMKSLLGDEETRDWDWNDIQYEIDSSRDFEILISDLWGDMGFETQLTKQTADGGYDVLAEKSGIGGWGSASIVIETKWYTDTAVSRPSVQKLEGVRNGEGADKAILVTSSTFGGNARDWGDGMEHIELVNSRDLISYLNHSSLTPPEVEYH